MRLPFRLQALKPLQAIENFLKSTFVRWRIFDYTFFFLLLYRLKPVLPEVKAKGL